MTLLEQITQLLRPLKVAFTQFWLRTLTIAQPCPSQRQLLSFHYQLQVFPRRQRRFVPQIVLL